MDPKTKKAKLEARRRQAVALLENGMTASEVADRLGVWPGSVFRWKEAYKEAGTEGLRAKPYTGAPPRLPIERRAALDALLLKGPVANDCRRDPNIPSDQWTLHRMADLIRKRFGVDYDISNVSRLVHAMGWHYGPPIRGHQERGQTPTRTWHKEDPPRRKKRQKETRRTAP